MTTREAEERYLAEHVEKMKNKGYAVYNPHNKPETELPVIYGFNNGGNHGFLRAELLAEDGTPLGAHLCSNEGYMLHDLGILEGTMPGRHEEFKAHYPDGYRMDFVGAAEVKTHVGIAKAIARNALLPAVTED